MKNRINENVSDKNMCDTFDTPYRPLAAFMALVVAVACVSSFL